MDIARLSDDAARWYIAQIDNILKLFFMYFSFLHWDYILPVCGRIYFLQGNLYLPESDNKSGKESLYMLCLYVHNI